MSVNLNDIEDLNKEFEKVVRNFHDFHSEMENQRLFYQNSAFYKWQTGQQQRDQQVTANLLRLFADKNIEYTTSFPKFKVPTPGSDEMTRKAASLREKILYGTWRKNGGAVLQKKWAFDATIRGVAIAETGFDLKKRCVFINRYSPLKCYWQLSSDGGQMRVIAFWAAFAITADEAKKRYGVSPTSDVMSNLVGKENVWRHIDGKDWFTEVIRWDDKTRVRWVGNKLVEEPHNHMMGDIPIDMCMPFEDGDDTTNLPAFYLAPLVPLQAELNDVIRRRSRIVHRMSSPVAWVRGLMARKLDDVEEQMKQPGGGFVGLSKDGEMGLMQINDTRMLNEHEADIILQMMRLSGYGNAAFGEPIGANTSGDAIAMYFNATQRKIEQQMVSWIAFWESINSKILRLYDTFGRSDEQFNLAGYSPLGTILSYTGEDGHKKIEYQGGTYNTSFDKSVIAGDYISIAEPPTAAPKNEIKNKELAINAVQQKFMSRTTAYEQYGIDSPEDELALLEAEQSSPLLNPDGTAKILESQQPTTGQPPTGGLPAATSQPINGGAYGQPAVGS